MLKDDGSLQDNACLMLLGVMLFPHCLRSAQLYCSIKSEGESEMGHLLDVSIAARNQTASVAGQSAWTLAKLAEHHPTEASLSRAHYLTVYGLKTARTRAGKSYPLKSMSGTRKAFDTYRDVAHFWAARNAHPELFRDSDTGDGLCRFLSAASVYEALLDEVETLLWEPWRVPNEVRGDEGIVIQPLSVEELKMHKDYHPALR
ncbi:hypothetical protein T8T21_14100 [Limimaricola variabilis]|uniref:hypothetical protein n=1 Tax=Limimaricola variabilis TaxID=1492771 RepID=UPI002AC9C12D|nr:hypothetical protein [Limimaricola variabilis]WPY94223.1 hypothetical protein T8T21_14100 [Limimaricola variabilis]